MKRRSSRARSTVYHLRRTSSSSYGFILLIHSRPLHRIPRTPTPIHIVRHKVARIEQEVHVHRRGPAVQRSGAQVGRSHAVSCGAEKLSSGKTYFGAGACFSAVFWLSSLSSSSSDGD